MTKRTVAIDDDLHLYFAQRGAALRLLPGGMINRVLRGIMEAERRRAKKRAEARKVKSK
ncbi:MAG TPA: hypothetical protein VII92_18210 [Anaerolineae bacterium]